MIRPDRDHDPDAPSFPPDEGGDDFAALLAESESRSRALPLRVGEKVRAKVIHIGKETVFCELSPTQEGSMPRAELTDDEGRLTVAVGDALDVFVIADRDGIQLSRKVGRDSVDVEMLQQAVHTELPVEGLVTGVNKGGLEVAMGGVRAFCPIGQADIGFVEDAATFVGKTLQFVVREVRDGGRSVVLSRRALLEAQRAAQAEQLLATLAVGQQLEGTVTRIADFGVFLDLGGLDGLVPISELSYGRVDDPRSVVKEGERLTVAVLRIEDDPKRHGRPRIALSLKAAQPDPLDRHAAEITEGATLNGRVTRLEKFGAFVELFPGVEGLVHVSEMSGKRVRHPSDVVQVGDEVTVRVLGVQRAERRISLSLREAAPDPGAAAALTAGSLVDGTVERVERFGVFVKLASGGTALLPAAESATPPGADLAKAFPVGSTHALAVLAVDERGRVKVSKRAREAAEERAVLADFNERQPRGGGFGTLGDLLKAKAPRPRR